MKKIIDLLDRKFVPIASKIGSQRHLVAVRDGFVVIMPLMIVGSLAVLINNLPIDAYQNLMNSIFGGDGWKNFASYISQGAFNVMSLIVVYTVSAALAKSYSKDGVTAGAISLASLVTIMASFSTEDGATSGLPFAWMGAQGLFIAIFVALIATEIFVRLSSNKKLVITMPEGVPPAVAKSFSSLMPGMLTIIFFALIRVLFNVAGVESIHQSFYDLLQAPIVKMANTLPTALLIVFLNHLFWFFGLNGGSILEPIMQSVYLPAIDQNIAALEKGLDIPNIVTKPFFDSFVYLGGTGATLALVVSVLLFTRKNKPYKVVSELSLAPSLFNINEPVMFGFPIVLNPLLFIPFLLVPMILTVISYVAISTGLVPKTIVLVPWTTPPVIGGFLATGSWRGGALALINFVIAVVLYMPFLKAAEKQFLQSSEGEQ
ncbi:PTS cellobiose transporter subunit IIC [uncultured Enterococcus sp.]|uniref:PTS cellobiose transporter subunit IIC n=1 Tax=uncultured Enterococcus sp. TaxID=167972 RepID=UPI002AA5E725|nr:PTS cellobiose transporter subunit IIC [uncultured Enterococcus sp.]